MTRKQQKFIREYCIDLNATRAAIAAGYSEKGASVQASRLLRNVKVSAEIGKVMARNFQRLEISAEYVLSTIEETIETAKLEKESFAVLKGCELLGKYLKLFTDKIEHSGQVGHVDLTELSDEQLAEVQRIVESSGKGQSHPQ